MNGLKVRSGLVAGILIILIVFLSMQVSLAPNTTSINESASQRAIARLENLQPGELLYSNDFSSSKSGWDIYSNGDFLTAY